MWPNPLEIADLVTFTEEFLNRKRHFLRGECEKKATKRDYILAKMQEEIFV